MTSNKPNQWAFETRAIHTGQEADPLTGAIVPPIYTASTYVQDDIGRNKGYFYSRPGNPTRHNLEACLADLEGAAAAFAFPTGLAAAATVLELIDTGAHIVAHDDLYGGIYRLLAQVRTRSAGHQTTFVDFSNLEDVRAAIRDDTALLWYETPSNPLLKIVDIDAISQVARNNGTLSVCDNTFSSPYCQRPLELGADIVIHSATKFLNGHSDLLAGVAAVSHSLSDDHVQRLKFLQNAVGAVLSPTDCVLLQRSLKTLPIRMAEHSRNATQIAEFLSAEQGRLRLKEVLYPGHPDHPGHAIAAKQMSSFGSIVTLILEGGLNRARDMLSRTNLFQFAVSLGGVESMIQHPASLTHAVVPKDRREAVGVVDGLVRLSVGIENVDDLIADLEQSLKH